MPKLSEKRKGKRCSAMISTLSCGEVGERQCRNIISPEETVCYWHRPRVTPYDREIENDKVE